jgi:hypothetical protein
MRFRRNILKGEITGISSLHLFQNLVCSNSFRSSHSKEFNSKHLNCVRSIKLKLTHFHIIRVALLAIVRLGLSKSKILDRLVKYDCH